MVYVSEFCFSRMYLSTRKIINMDANVFINNYQVNLGRRILQFSIGQNIRHRLSPAVTFGTIQPDIYILMSFLFVCGHFCEIKSCCHGDCFLLTIASCGLA